VIVYDTKSFQNILGRSKAKCVPVLIQQPINIPINSYNDKWYPLLALGLSVHLDLA
jgi:hypothetical protein